MKEKTFFKLQQRFLALPLHHINTDVILEPDNTEDGRYCKKYLNLVGYKYRSIISFPVLSELLLNILRLESFEEQWDALHLITSLLKEKRIEMYAPAHAFEIEAEICKLDNRIKPLDRQIVASSVEDKATLVTIDRDLFENSKLKMTFGIEIKHPKELI